mmetsp:Transcript_148/g.189  ORF Transcript_148/g.189 Transcript_148/m.189 type:complete len:83 (+) Transcript_148:224-472(+)|eukprot:scaffold51852_cov27-Tisochrysis_lutea.AAC.4
MQTRSQATLSRIGKRVRSSWLATGGPEQHHHLSEIGKRVRPSPWLATRWPERQSRDRLPTQTSSRSQLRGIYAKGVREIELD